MKLRPRQLLKTTNLLFAVYLIFATAFLLLLIELALWGVDWVTGGKLPPLIQDANYPAHPNDFLKVAIFGESSAKGYNAEYGFEKILFYELKRPHDQPFLIRNYARAGFPFHGYQAEILKANIRRYDLFLIYAGHNEVHNYLDRVGKFKKPQFKRHRTFLVMPGDDWSLLRRMLDEHSRIYAFWWRYHQRALDAAVEKADGWQAPIRTGEFLPESMLPPGEQIQLETNFQNDLVEIGRLAQKYNKHVIIMSVPSREDWKPMCSVRNGKLSGEEAARWWNEYRQGEQLRQEGKPNDALAHFQIAQAIDDGVAILNYQIGMTLAGLDRLGEAHRFLRRAIDTDGFPVRALNSLSAIAASVATRFPNVHYCDMVGTFEQLVERGCQWRQLFADFQHPSFAGHVVIAHGFLNNIQALKPFGYHSPVFDAAKLHELVASYHREFGFSPAVFAGTERNKAIWACNTAEISAYPDDFFALAEESLRRYYENSDKGTEAQQEYHYWSNRIQARRAERLIAR